MSAPLCCVYTQVYWGNGCQIIPPHDAGIAAAIEANLALLPLPALDALPSGLVTDPTAAIASSYYASLESHLRALGIRFRPRSLP